MPRVSKEKQMASPEKSKELTRALLYEDKQRTTDARQAYRDGDASASIAAHKRYQESVQQTRNQLMHGFVNGDDPNQVDGLAQHDEPVAAGGSSFVKPAVFGGLDGISTAFALLAGGFGAEIDFEKLISVAVATVLAGAFSMAFGEYISSSAERQVVLNEKAREEWEVANFPSGEVAEMVELYCQKGLQKEDAVNVATTLAKYPDFWVEHMLLHECGLIPPDGEDDESLKSSLVMFVSFAVCGFIPILTYFLSTKLLIEWQFHGDVTEKEESAFAQEAFDIVIIASMLTLFLLGCVKNAIAEASILGGGIVMLMQGVVGGSISFCLGRFGGGGIA